MGILLALQRLDKLQLWIVKNEEIGEHNGALWETQQPSKTTIWKNQPSIILWGCWNWEWPICLQAGIEENHKEKVDRTHVLPAFTQPGMKMPVLRRDFLFSGNGS